MIRYIVHPANFRHPWKPHLSCLRASASLCFLQPMSKPLQPKRCCRAGCRAPDVGEFRRCLNYSEKQCFNYIHYNCENPSHRRTPGKPPKCRECSTPQRGRDAELPSSRRADGMIEEKCKISTLSRRDTPKQLTPPVPKRQRRMTTGATSSKVASSDKWTREQWRDWLQHNGYEDLDGYLADTDASRIYDLLFPIRLGLWEHLSHALGWESYDIGKFFKKLRELEGASS